MVGTQDKRAARGASRNLTRNGDVAPTLTPAGVRKFAVGEAIEAAQASDLAALDAIRAGPPPLAADSDAVRTILAGDSPDDAARFTLEITQEAAPVAKIKRTSDELAEDWRSGGYPYKYKMLRRDYEEQKFLLQSELLKLQSWVKETRQRIVILFEGRDAAGKGGVIKRITQRLNPRVCRVAALPAPNDRERTQWYFQRYASHLPAAGEIVLFDRSWYNRAGVERVMGFCTDDEYEEFFRSVPEFERMLVRSGIQLVKYWFSITDEEQHLRFLGRIHDPLKQWKLSPMDLESRRRWEDYTRAKEIMLERTHIDEAPWWVVQAVDKKQARLNCIDHLLGLVPYHDIPHPCIDLPQRVRHEDYIRRPVPASMMVPERY